jgi:UDP-N-acetylglucosamine/UDP-N-acetylgalactosamine diphosphorylase
LERLVFDVFDLVPLEKVVFEVGQRDEFSPLKNEPGTNVKENNPETSKRDALPRGRRWIESAQGVVLDDGDKDAGVEISPAAALSMLRSLMIGFARRGRIAFC